MLGIREWRVSFPISATVFLKGWLVVQSGTVVFFRMLWKELLTWSGRDAVYEVSWTVQQVSSQCNLPDTVCIIRTRYYSACKPRLSLWSLTRSVHRVDLSETVSMLISLHFTTNAICSNVFGKDIWILNTIRIDILAVVFVLEMVTVNRQHCIISPYWTHTKMQCSTWND